MNAFGNLPIYEGMEFRIRIGHTFSEARGGTVGWGNALQAGRSRVQFTGIFQWHNPSGRTMALGSTQPLTEMITWG
jgi:hypothetical protein